MKKKNLNYYMNLDYPITVQKEKDGEKDYYVVEIPDLPGCGSQASTLEEALKKVEIAKKFWISGSIKKGLPIPEPVQEDLYSGKFILRIPARLHMKLSKDAERENVSLNQYIRSVLEKRGEYRVLNDKINILIDEINKLNKKMDTPVGEKREALITSDTINRIKSPYYKLGKGTMIPGASSSADDDMTLH